MEWYRRWTDRRSSAQLYQAGFWGTVVFDALCDISAERDFGGVISEVYCEASFLVRQINLQLFDCGAGDGVDTREDIVKVALLKLLKVGLIRRDEDNLIIDGWERRQPRLPKKSTERVRKHRESLKKKTETEMKHHETRFTPFQNVSETRETDKEKEKEKEKEKKKHTSKAEHETFKTLWNSRADLAFARLSVLTEARAKAIERFLKAHNLEEFEAGIEKANKSSFLKGQGNTGFKASFDWILKSDNFVKLIEGNYDDRLSALAKKPSVVLTQEQIKKQYEPVDTKTYSPALKHQFGLPLTDEEKEILRQMGIAL